MKQFFNWPLLFVTVQLFILGEISALENGTCTVTLCSGRTSSRLSSSPYFSRRIRPCNCGTDCITYGECCKDSPSKPASNSTRFDCVDQKFTSYGVKMIRSCSMRQWLEHPGGYRVSRNCSSSNNFEEQTSNYTLKVPVTTPNGITYGNQFCASCYIETTYTMWNIRFSCDTTSNDKEYNTSEFNISSTQNKYIFNNTLQQWTYVDGNFTETCTLSATLPRQLRRSIKKCQPKLVKSCPSGAPSTYRRQCANYTSMVKHTINGTWYKNEYCALCNNVSSADLTCDRKSSISSRSTTSTSPRRTILYAVSEGSSPQTISSTTQTATPSTTRPSPTTTQTTPSTTISSRTTPNAVANNTIEVREFLHITVKKNCKDLIDSLMLMRLTVETKTTNTIKRTRLKDSNLLTAYPVRICKDTDDQVVEEPLEESYPLKYIVNLGVVISILFTLLHLYDFLFSNSDPTQTRRIFASYGVTLIIGNIGFLASNTTEGFCHLLGSVTYFGFLTSFFWLSALAFDVSCKLWCCIQETDIFDKNSTSKKFTIYSLVSWIFPPVIAFIMSYVAERDGDFILEGRIYETCWFQNDKTLLLFFIFPLTITMSVNWAFYLFSAYVVWGQKTSVVKLFSKHGIDFKFHTGLIITSNLMWSAAFIAMYDENSFLWVCFACLDATLGLLVYVCSPVKHAFSSRITEYFDKRFLPVGENVIQK